MNHYQDFKMAKQALIEQLWMFNKIQKTREGRIYTKKSYNRLIIQSAFFFENLSRDFQRQ